MRAGVSGMGDGVFSRFASRCSCMNRKCGVNWILASAAHRLNGVKLKRKGLNGTTWMNTHTCMHTHTRADEMWIKQNENAQALPRHLSKLGTCFSSYSWQTLTHTHICTYTDAHTQPCRQKGTEKKQACSDHSVCVCVCFPFCISSFVQFGLVPMATDPAAASRFASLAWCLWQQEGISRQRVWLMVTACCWFHH